MTSIRQVWKPGSLSDGDGLAESIAAKDLNNLYRTSCYFESKARYTAFCALYAVMRLIDDRIDDVLARGLPVEEVARERENLTRWEQRLASCLSGSASTAAPLNDETAALLQAFDRASRRFPVPPRIWTNFFAAMREDLSRRRFPTYESFLRYAEGATVAPTTVYLFLIAAEETAGGGRFDVPADFDLETCGRDLGLFAYIAHVLRDLAEDLTTGTNGLVYVAADDMAVHGVTEETLREDLAAGTARPAVRGLVEDLAGRARTLLRTGQALTRPLEGRLSPDRAFILALITRIYEAILDKIAACDYDPMTGRHLLTDREKERLALGVAGQVDLQRCP